MIRILVAAVFAFVFVTPSVHGHPGSPIEVSRGNSPYVTLSGMLTGGSGTKVYTVPDGQAPSGPPDHPKSDRVTTALSALSLPPPPRPSFSGSVPLRPRPSPAEAESFRILRLGARPQVLR
mgnify:CR=1 FL=1